LDNKVTAHSAADLTKKHELEKKDKVLEDSAGIFELPDITL
jgi:hypothetical protein